MICYFCKTEIEIHTICSGCMHNNIYTKYKYGINCIVVDHYIIYKNFLIDISYTLNNLNEPIHFISDFYNLSNSLDFDCYKKNIINFNATAETSYFISYDSELNCELNSENELRMIKNKILEIIL